MLEVGADVGCVLWDDVVFVFFFFFQAEDGIRDADVTGVQTCALPIFQPETRLGHGPDLGQPVPAALAQRVQGDGAARPRAAVPADPPEGADAGARAAPSRDSSCCAQGRGLVEGRLLPG